MFGLYRQSQRVWRAAAGGEFSWSGKQEGSLDGHRMDRPLGLPLPNHLLNPGIGSAVKPSREQWVRKNGGQRPGKRRSKVWKAEGKSQESGGQRPGKRRAKVGKAEGKGQESGGQRQGKRRAKVGKAEGKGRESGGQRSGKRRAKQRQTFCLTLQVCADDYCAQTAVLCCRAGH